MRPPHPLLALATVLATLTGCLFDEQPPCRIGGDACGAGLICVDRQCVAPGRTDRGPDPDAAADSAPPDQAAPDAAPDAGPPDATPDLAPPDAAPPDMTPPDCGAEICNGLDDDCDGRADEEVERCAIPDHCHWRYRGHQGYLFCDDPVSEAEAIRLCRTTLALAMAVPDTCDESDWLWATGNLVPSTVEWGEGVRGRAWWLGLRLEQADVAGSVIRTDRAVTPLPAGGCWATGEPDPVFTGETCVNLLYNPATEDWGWNDDGCDEDQGNPVNALCEVPCDPDSDADGDGENACVDCDDRDPDANSGDGIDRCALAPDDGFPP